VEKINSNLQLDVGIAGCLVQNIILQKDVICIPIAYFKERVVLIVM